MTNISIRWIPLTVFFLISLVVGFLLLQHMSSAEGTSRVQYRVLEFPAQDDSAKLEAELNAYGQGGWELVLVNLGNVTRPAPRFIFKRVQLP